MRGSRLSRRRLVGIAAGLIAAPTLAASEEPKVAPRRSPVLLRRLTCEYRADPLGLDTTEPRFGWQLFDPAGSRGQRQTAYRIRVASRRALLTPGATDLWDSDRVASDQSVAVYYAGRPLIAGDDCFWQVMLWDRDGLPTAWSEPARFSIGPLAESDWHASWIGMESAAPDECPHFRKTFTLAALPETAIAHVGTIGYQELYVNGKRVGDGVLAPSVSNLRKRALFVSYDIRDRLKKGPNVVAIWAASGWAQFQGVNPPVDFRIAKSPLCIARLQFGSERHPGAPPVVTDPTWLCQLSNTRHLGQWKNGDFGGDFVDADADIAGWNAVAFDTTNWEEPSVYQPGLTLSPDPVEPNRRCETIKAKHIAAVGGGVYRVEMAEIFTGWLEFTARARPRTVITVKTSSRPDHVVEFNQINTYVVGHSSSGQGLQTATFSERFSYHQYHYVTIEGLEVAPTIDQIVGHRVSNDRRRIGAFTCSNPLLQSIYDATIRTYVNLTTGGMTVDCPHRERLGYGGDGHTSLEVALDHFTSNAFFAKWARDFCDVQEPTGDIFHTAPTMDGGGGPAWSGFVITLPHAVYLATGDRRILEQAYPAAQRFLTYLRSQIGDEGLLNPLPGPTEYPSDGSWYFLGDWAAPHRNENSHSPEALLFNNCYFVYILGLTAEIAEAIGKPTEAAEYRALRDFLRQAIDRRFYKREANAYLDALQTHCILPLLAGVPTEEHVAGLMKTFENELLVTRSGHLDTGLHGTYFMTKYLTEHERSDLIYTYATQTTFPSYGELLAKGYTTWPEYWGDADSKTHGCLNGIGGWFQRGLAGIRPDPAAPGYRHVIIRPAFVGDLTHVEAHHDGPYGRIAVRWDRDPAGHVTVDVTIPPNSTADVYLPAAAGSITESGATIASLPNAAEHGRTESGVYRVASGRYLFRFAIA